MLTVAEAKRAIGQALPEFAPEDVAVDQACGRILRQAVVAERDQPPFDRVMMDGIALRFAEFRDGRRDFRVAGTQHAGDAAQALQDDAHCIEVMTGAVLPGGCDCVIPVERIAVQGGTATVEAGYAATAGQFVHPRASDHAQGHALLHPGRKLAPIDIALLASAGLTQVSVARQPAISVISTGNELVPAGQPIAAHQIRLSNGPALRAMLAAQQFSDSRHLHLPDDEQSLRAAIDAALDASNVLVLSGGVSMGKADFVPGILAELGVERVFHKVSQRPGKPMWFGMGAAGQAVFALPGNPVSALTCCRHYVLPALLQASGGTPQPAMSAILAEDYRFTPALTCLLPVRLLDTDDGRLCAAPVLTNTSGDFTTLAASHGYLELPQDDSEFAAGSVQPLHWWDRV